MAATTISGYSDGLTAALAPLYAPLKPNQYEGRVRTINFRLTLAAQVSGTSIAVGNIPKGARIIGGEIIASATLAASATIAVGLAGKDGTGYIDDAVTGGPGLNTTGAATVVGTPISDGVAVLKAAAALSTTQVPFALTQALGYLYETAKECWLTLTTGTGTVGTEVITGSLRYVVD
jgi:hypothetical protein